MNSHVDLPSAAVQEYWSTKAAPRLSLLDRLSPRGCAKELAAARHTVDDELSALQMVMCAMRTRRNNFSLIGKLPPEILSRIFSFHAIDQPTMRGRLGWVTVTHVCCHWRQVALSDPNLWTTIVFGLGAEWTEEMLARSKAALISYRRNLSLMSSLDDEVTLRKHLSHIQRLALHGNPESLARAVRAFNTPAPHLESLELSWNETQSRELCITLPSDLFAHDAPKLRHVTLAGCAVPWESPLFRDLTHLDIHIPPVKPAAFSDLLSIPTLKRLLDILEAMPSLQVLSLMNCLPRRESSSRVVPLRHMSKLSLGGSVSEVVAVLERVSLPSSAFLNLNCSDRNPPDGLIDTLASLLALHFPAPKISISPLTAINIDMDYMSTFKISVWDTDTDILYHSPSRFKPFEPARLQLTFDNPLLPIRVCKALPLWDLHTLSITFTFTDFPWSAADCMGLCIRCPKVTHLSICPDSAYILIPALIERNAFPSLITLVMWDDGSYFTDWLPELPVIVRSRSKPGIPARHFILKSSWPPVRWIKCFKEDMNDVVWDFNN